MRSLAIIPRGRRSRVAHRTGTVVESDTDSGALVRDEGARGFDRRTVRDILHTLAKAARNPHKPSVRAPRQEDRRGNAAWETQ